MLNIINQSNTNQKNLNKNLKTNTTTLTSNIQINSSTQFNKEVLIRESEPLEYDTELIISGNLMELVDYEYPIRRNIYKPVGRVNENNTNEKIKKENRLKVLNRIKKDIKRIARENVYIHHNKPYSLKLLTLTFAHNLKDVKIANNYFKEFMKKLNKYVKNKILPSKSNKKWLRKKGMSNKAINKYINNYEGIKYTRVLEFQKRGAVHYHIILYNFPFIPDGNDAIRDLWQHGWQVQLEQIKSKVTNGAINEVMKYLTKYLTKYINQYKNGEIDVDKYRGIKYATNSKGLNSPKIIKINHKLFKNSDVYKDLMDFIKYNTKILCEPLTINNKHLGSITYSVFRFNRRELESLQLLYNNLIYDIFPLERN